MNQNSTVDSVQTERAQNASNIQCRAARSRLTKVRATQAALVLLGLIQGGASACAAPPDVGSEDPNNWPQYRRTDNQWSYSPLDQINVKNVSKLKVAWVYQGGDSTQGNQQTPLAIDGIVYSISSGNRVAAIEGKTGKVIWRYNTKLASITKSMPFAPYSRGVAIGRGKVFVATSDGRGIALDQKTGKEIWQTKLTDPANCHGCNFTSPPVVAGDMLTFGSTGGELATAGKVYGVEADTGKKIWQFDTIKQDEKSWPGQSGKTGGGGAWMPGTYDAETSTVYYGTGNPGHDFYAEERKGDNLYTSSIIALDPKTGKLKWHRQAIKHDVWDYDSPYESMLFKKDGKDLLVHLNKSGFVFVLDKKNGDIDNVWRLSNTMNFAKDIDKKTGELIGRVDPPVGKETKICPSAFGARSWNSGSYSPKTGLWYTNAQEFCGNLKPTPQKVDPKDFGTLQIGAPDLGRMELVPGHKAGRLDARDPFTGKLKWSWESDIPSFSAVMSTGGGLVFNGDPLGNIRAFDADNGKVLWTFNTGAGLRSGLSTYSVDGKQYILVPSGWGSFAGMVLPQIFPEMDNSAPAATLIAFTLED